MTFSGSFRQNYVRRLRTIMNDTLVYFRPKGLPGFGHEGPLGTSGAVRAAPATGLTVAGSTFPVYQHACIRILLDVTNPTSEKAAAGQTVRNVRLGTWRACATRR
jgi:hypothetical protein